MSVKNLDINPRFTKILLKAHISNVKQLMLISKFELVKKTGLDETSISQIVNEASKSIYKIPPTAVWNILNKTAGSFYEHFKLKTGCPTIDNLLKGGIIFPGITEISGESASGKTQFCMQLCLCVQNAIEEDGFGGGALYICTEDVFPNKRLHQMASEYSKLTGKSTNYTDQIYIEHVADLDELWSLLDVRIHALLSQHDIKLLIIDSIAALFRAEYDFADITDRSKMLSRFGRLLHTLSHSNKMCVVCVNQVSDDFSDLKIDDDNGKDGSPNVIPTLGLTWSYFVSTRLMLSRTRWSTSMFPSICKNTKIDPSLNCNVRRLKVVHSTHIPSSKTYFVVDRTGLNDFPLPEQS